MMPSEKLQTLVSLITTLYTLSCVELPFHGIKHLAFVAKKGKLFAISLNADPFLVESAAWVHDLNYFARRDQNQPELGASLREEMLQKAGYSDDERKKIGSIVTEINTWSRDTTISLEAKALSDADMLFSSLPITPILFTSKYMEETGQSLVDLAKTVTELRSALLDKEIFFYSDLAKEKYLDWAKTIVALFREIGEALQDEDIRALQSN